MKRIGSNPQRPGNGASLNLVSRAQSPLASGTTPASAIRNAVEPLRLLPEQRAYDLMRLFFSDTGMMFPFIDEQHVLKAYTIFKDNRYSGITRSWLCLFNSIFAFATYISAKPDQPVSKNAAESEVFFNRALALSKNESLRFADVETGKILIFFPVLIVKLTRR